jgi:maltooligosyltrehalose trehalohydrolase
VWAPNARTLDVHASNGVHPLAPDDHGVFKGSFPGAAGDQYLLVLDGVETYPDPCSRFQPHGVRGPS